jgi:hypothetical protein
MAGYGFEGIEDDPADVIAHDILVEAAFGAGVDYHEGSPGRARRGLWGKRMGERFSIDVVLV